MTMVKPSPVETGLDDAGPTDGRARRPLPFPGILRADLRAAYERDPALRGIKVAEVILYQGLWALWAHRTAHLLWRLDVPFLPRLMSQIARMLTGIEIHPGARIGRGCFIDHGMGVVIGETAELGENVTLFQGVTLGGRGFWRDVKGSKRHPTIGDDVVLGAGSTVLGPVTVGDGCRIGAHALVFQDLPPHTTVTALPAVSHEKSQPEMHLLDYEI